MSEPRPIVFDKALGRRGHVVSFTREHVLVQWDRTHDVSTIKALDFTTERYTLVLPRATHGTERKA